LDAINGTPTLEPAFVILPLEMDNIDRVRGKVAVRLAYADLSAFLEAPDLVHAGIRRQMDSKRVSTTGLGLRTSDKTLSQPVYKTLPRVAAL
jgi:hypothetical protein